MADFAPEATQTTPPGAAGPAVPVDDPLASLKRMSTTAGVGGGDYVAINPAAVAATVLGLGTVFVPIFGSNVLLVVPLAAIVCAVVAWRQIGGSNGTQAGRLLATAGLVLALLVGGGTVAAQAVARWKARPDEQRIVEMMRSLGRDIGAKNYREAYALFSDRFRARVTEDHFNEVLDSLNKSRDAGAVHSLEWNGRMDFSEDTGTGDPVAVAMALVTFERPVDPYRLGMRFKKVDGRWLIDDVPILFPADKPKRDK